jgi:hypothetical protein
MKRWTPAITLVAGLSLGIFLGGPLIHGQVTPSVPLPKELTSFRGVVKTVLPAVVSIEARAKVIKTQGRSRPQNPLDQGQIPEEFRRFFEEFGRIPDFGRFPEANDVPRLGFGSAPTWRSSAWIRKAHFPRWPWRIRTPWRSAIACLPSAPPLV